ncbi:MAG: VOC family protein [Proteobacteria bacterium]|nr:VOC family protein [Pseudomonadota bacterium]
MVRGLDHLVMVVNDLEAARGVYERLGFTTTPRALHPFGTENFLVQMQGNFLEVVGIADAGMIPPHGPGVFSFARGNADFLARREGMSSLVFQTQDARADRRDFLAAKLNAFENVDFSRQATLPDGSEVTVAFSLAFVTDPAMPETTFFTCQQHAPEHFWKPAYQVHANGAHHAAEAIMVAPDPAAHAGFFRGTHGADAVTIKGEVGSGDAQGGDGGLRVATDLGSIVMLTPAAYRARFGADTVGPVDTAHFAGFRIQVEDLARQRAILDDAGIAVREASGALQVGPSGLSGIVMEFAAA